MIEEVGEHEVEAFCLKFEMEKLKTEKRRNRAWGRLPTWYKGRTSKVRAF